ncbi:MAG: hypothetical protein KDA80_15505 [Planctomycetaceae bacterium]|nr:hypothetical protein [Planctomycetaceae bacterium]
MPATAFPIGKAVAFFFSIQIDLADDTGTPVRDAFGGSLRIVKLMGQPSEALAFVSAIIKLR